MEEHGPGDYSQEIVKVCKEEIIQRIAVTWNVTHVVEEDKGLPEAVRLVHQFANFVVLVVQRRQGIVLAAQRSRVRLGQSLNVLAHLLETVAQDETYQVEVCHGEHVNASHEEDPDNLDANPGDEKSESILVHVFECRQ